MSPITPFMEQSRSVALASEASETASPLVALQRLWVRHQAALMLAGALLVGLALRWYELSTRDMWTDEAGKIAMAQGPLSVFWADLVGWGLTPPAYFLLLHAVIAVVGDSLLSYRLLSFLAGVATIWATYQLARALFDARVAMLAAVLVAVSPYFIWHSQDASTYSVTGFVSALAMWRFWEAITRERTRDWLLFAAATALALYVQHYAWLVVAFEGLYVLAVYLPTHRRLPRRWWIGASVLAVVYLPQVPVLLHQLALSRQAGYVGRSVFSWFATLASNTFNVGSGYRVDEFRAANGAGRLASSPSRLAELVLAIAAPLAAGAIGAVCMVWRRPPQGIYAVLLFAGASAIGAYTLFLARHLSIVAVLYFILMAAGILAMRGTARGALFGLLLLTDVLSLHHFYASPWSRSRPQDWQGAAHVVAAQARPGDVVVVRAWIGGATALQYQLWSFMPTMVVGGSATTDARHMPSPAPPSWGPMAPLTRITKVAYTWNVNGDRQLVETTDPANLSPAEEAARIEYAVCASCHVVVIYDGWNADGWPTELEPLAATMTPINVEERSPYLRVMVLQRKAMS